MAILHHSREKRSSEASETSETSEAKRIVEIMPNQDICFAGKKLKHPMPSDPEKAEIIREALNTFILMLSHTHGQTSNHFETI